MALYPRSSSTPVQTGTPDPRAAENSGPQLNATVWSLTALSLGFLVLRLYSKLWRRRKLWWDDYVLVAGWVALALSAALMSICVSLGLGHHGRFLDPKKLDQLLMFSYAAGFCSIIAAVWSKSSFAITLLSISDGWTRRVVWFILLSVNVVLGVNATIQWVQCWPPEKMWHKTVPGTCWISPGSIRAYNTFVAAYSGTTDIVLAILPWKIIWHAKIRPREKLGALFAMSMGVFAGITSFLKITSLYAIGNVDMMTTVNLFIFGTAEGAITIMAASIPILRALFHRDAHRNRY